MATLSEEVRTAFTLPVETPDWLDDQEECCRDAFARGWGSAQLRGLAFLGVDFEAAARHVEAEQGEAFDLDWLLSIGGTLIDHDDEEWIVEFDGAIEVFFWQDFTVNFGEVERRLKIKTRADVLNLLRALGIEATRT
jgi:hypothetical protein